MPLFGRRMFQRDRDGMVSVKLTAEERELLADLPRQLAQVMEETPGDPALQRLAPPAYAGALGHLDAEYQHLVGDDIAAGRRAELALLAGTAHRNQLNEEEAWGWLHALNDLRLFLGTRLDLTEETDETSFADDEVALHAFYIYAYLSEIQGHLIAAVD